MRFCAWGFFIIAAGFSLHAQTYDWVGTTSGDWNTASNWSPNGIPGAGAHVRLQSGTAPHACVLDMDRSIARLTVSADSLDLNGFTLTATNRINITGGVFGKGQLLGDFYDIDHALFLDSIRLEMTGTGFRRHEGFNRFEGPLNVVCNSGGTFRMAQTFADTFLAPVQITNSTTRRFDLCYDTECYFAADLTLDNSGTGGMSINHLLTGPAFVRMAAGGAIKTNGFSNGPLRINRFEQLGSAANDSLTPTEFIGINTLLGGGLRMATTSANLRMDTSTVYGDVRLFAQDDIDLAEVAFAGTVHMESTDRFILTGRNAFSTLSGNSTLIRQSASNDTWEGGTTFGGPTTITNNGSGRLQMANIEGDTFSSTVLLRVLDAGAIRFGYNGNSLLLGDLTLEHSGIGGITLGQGNGSVHLVGANILNGGFSGGELRMERVTQSGANGNDAFAPTLFDMDYSHLDGGLSITATSGDIILDSCSIDGPVYFEGAVGGNLDLRDRCAFAYTAGTATFILQDDANITWDGGCTFGDLRIELTGSFNLRMANNEGDTCLGDVELVNTGGGQLEFGYNGNNLVEGDLTLNNTSTGGLTVCESNGLLTLNGSILTDGFSNGEFRMERVVQNGGATNGVFNPTTFNGEYLELDAGLGITTTSGQLRLINCFIDGNVYLEGATDQNFTITDASGFAMSSGSAELVVDRASNTTWNGPTTFGELEVTNRGAGRLRMAGTDSDSCLADVELNAESAGQIEFSYNGSGYVAGNLTLNCSGAGGISLGEGNGTLNLSGNLSTNGFAGGELRMERLVQNGGSSNGAFTPTLFHALDSELDAGLDVRTSSSSVTFDHCSIDGDVYVEPATDQALILSDYNQFSTTNGTTQFHLDRSSAITNWPGGNTFGDFELYQQGSNTVRTSSSEGSTYLGDVLISSEGTGQIQFAYEGAGSIAGDLRLNNSNTGGISVCQRDGTLALSGNLLTDGFSLGSLDMERVTQSAGTANGSFNPTAANWESCSFAGTISLSTTDAGSTLELDGCSLLGGGNTIDAAGTLAVNNSNQIGGAGAISTLTNRSSSNVNWNGGNTFGPVHIIHSGSGRLRMANNSGDTFTDSLHVQCTSTGALEVAYNGTNAFEGPINLGGSMQSIAFGGAASERCVFRGGHSAIHGDVAYPMNIETMHLELDPGSILSLQVPVVLNDNLTLTRGHLATDATNLLILTDETTTSGLGSSDSYVQGPMRIVMTSSATVRSGLSFPVGSSTAWRPVYLEVAHSSGAAFRYDVALVESSAEALGWTLPMDIDSVSKTRYWTISRAEDATGLASDANIRTAPGQEPQVTLYFDTDDEVIQPDVLRICKNTTAAPSEWIDIGGTGTPAYDDDNPVAGSVTSTSSPSAFEGFSTFALGYGNIDALPVTLLAFDAFASGENAELTWSTAATWDHTAFLLEVSENGVHYAPLARLEGPVQSSTYQAYRYTHEGPHRGWRYYRLLEVGRSSDTTLLAHAAVSFEAPVASGELGSWQVYPNPTAGTCTVRLLEQAPNNRPVYWELTDAMGRVLQHGLLDPSGEAHPDLSDLPTGSYALRSSDGRYPPLWLWRQ